MSLKDDLNYTEAGPNGYYTTFYKPTKKATTQGMFGIYEDKKLFNSFVAKYFLTTTDNCRMNILNYLDIDVQIKIEGNKNKELIKIIKNNLNNFFTKCSKDLFKFYNK